ncbi:TcmI family type II polyketide cyclase [Salinispora oceanensis]|uniref:TcmI family type II polyketide cyclase n=1 Tax=Salinispora oceanensis TaxID=1050199 RepID=UPI00037B7B95|nr:TcmI family type II polyketide cyclase [Salinispora oceanensis]
MESRTLIVARLNQADRQAVADIFAESDATDLPHLIGARRRSLFWFHGLYFHLVESRQDINSSLYQARSHPLYDDIHHKLARYMTPYDPDWKEPKDSMAELFYSWEANDSIDRS